MNLRATLCNKKNISQSDTETAQRIAETNAAVILLAEYYI